MEKNTFGKEVNINGEYIYNVEKILVECEAKYNDKNWHPPDYLMDISF